MTHEEFAARREGSSVDFDGMYGAQCVDLVRQYFKDVWEVPRQPEGVVGAKDFALHDKRPVQQTYMDWTPYETGTAAPEGSVIVFNATQSNKFGHVAIVLKADSGAVQVLEQDGFAQHRGTYRCWRTYANCLGWLTRKEG